MKRKIALLLTGIMTAATLAGCSGGDPTGGSVDNQKETEKDAEDKGGEKASGAVSYTHLDVYKRQTMY